MDPTCRLVDKFRDLALNLIWERLLYLVHYHRNIEQLKERLVELTHERSSIQHRIDQATNNVEQIEDKVLHWLDEVHKISEQVEQLHKESQAKRECSITSCPNPWLRYKLSKRAKEMTQEVADICAKGDFDRVSHHVPPQTMPRLRNGESNEGIDSRVPIMNQLMEALWNPSVNMIGLCGPGGVGKTTIARELEMKGRNQKIFETVIWATVSDELNVENIQGQIAEKLGMQLNERTKEVRARRLYERLREEKKMLLILDDLWKKLDLGKIGIPFGDVENYSQKNEGCKILLTSRNDKLLSNCMKCQKIIKVGVLLENEALELFKIIAKLSIDSNNPELISIATEIVQKCGGLPLAIAAAAKALKEKDLGVWKDYLLQLKNHLRRNIPGIRQVDASLKLSYDPLSQKYKNIFLLSAMLSDNPSIEDLLMYSIGLNILEHTENIEDAHAEISIIVSELKSLNLFLDSFSNHCFTIHDVFRDVALSIASDELHAFIVRHKTLKDWPDEDKLAGYKGICLKESDISVDLPEELHGPRLEFFMLNSTKLDLTIPNMFFKSSKELKLLAFTNVHFALLPSLSFLQKLKELCLHSCVLKDITEVGSLKKLKVLSLAYSEIERLPVQLAELTSLQMLNLSHCSQLKVIPQKILSNLKKLEVLYMENSFDQWKVEGSSEASENASLDELKDLSISSLNIHIPNVSMLPEDLFSHMNLERYRILIGKHWEWWQVNYEISKTLKLELEGSIHLQHGVRKLLEKVEDLHLYGSNGHENVLYSHDGRGFPHLRHLEIESNDDIKYIVLNSAHHGAAFPKLESLELQNLNALEKLCEGPDVIIFHQLHTLKMKNLPALATDFCLKDKATNNASNIIFKSLFNNKVLLPKLEVLELSNLNRLIPLIWDDQLPPNSFSNLRTLTVESCGFVKLLPLHVLKYSNNLEELEVTDCYMLEIVFDFEDLNDYKEIESLSVVVPLKRLKLWNLPKLKNAWSNHCKSLTSFQALTGNLYIKDGATNNECNKIFKSLFDNNKVLLPKLEILELVELNYSIPLIWDDQISHNSFSNLRTLIVKSGGFVKLLPLHVLKSLNNLEELEASQCEKLETVFDFEDLNNYEEMVSSSVVVPLKKLKLWRLPNLKSIWSNHYQGIVSFPYLSNVDAYYCESLTSMFPESIAKGMLYNLEELQIKNCGIDMIVAKDHISESVDVAFEFPKLTSLELSFLPKLVNFYPGRHTLEWSNFQRLSIEYCDELEIFEKEISGSSEIPEGVSMLNSKYLLLSHNKVIGNLEELKLQGKQAEMIGSGQFPMYHFPKVKLLSLSIDQATISYKSLSKSFPHLLELQLRGDFEEAFERDGVAALVVPFSTLTLSNISTMGSLSTSLVSSPKLTHLKLTSSSYRLTTLMTSSTAQCLVHLTHLSISYCGQIEEIITKQEGEDDEDKEIFFKKLELLELDNMSRLERFCGYNYTFRFPLLDKLIITRCPNFKIFSPGLIDTPSLKSIQLSQKWGKHREILDTNINKTFYQQRFVASRELVLDEYDVDMIQNDQFPVDTCPEVEILRIERFVDEGVRFSYTLLERFPKLNELHVENSSFEEIFPSHAHIVDQIPPFKELYLANLTVLKVSKCHQLIYLVTDSIVKSLVNLETLEIDDCKKMEEIVRREPNEDVVGGIIFNGLKILRLTDLPRLKSEEDRRDFNNIEDWATNTRCRNTFLSLFGHNKVLLPMVEILKLSDLNPSISLIWDDQLSHNSFINLKILIVKSCGFVKLVPFHVLKTLNNLEELEVSECDMLEKVFDFEYLNDYKEIESSSVVVPLKKLKLWSLPKLKNVWSNHHQGNVSFPCLRSIDVSCCENLTSMFPTSMAKGMLHDLEELQIFKCGIDVIVAKDQVSASVAAAFEFPKLTSLELDHLPNLRNFHLQRHTLKCPHLQRLSIKYCDELEIFANEVSSSSEIHEEENTLNSKYPLLFLGKVIHNLEELILMGKEAEMIGSGQFPMCHFPKVKRLYLEVKKATTILHKSLWKSFPNLEKLKLEGDFKEAFGRDDVAALASPFSKLTLTHLIVVRCHGLTALMTSSIAQSLVHLMHLSIGYCPQLEEIITTWEGENNEDKAIIFSKLEFLELNDLPRLKRFCSHNYTSRFPLLQSVTIAKCPQLTMFCPKTVHTPQLQSAQVDQYEPYKDIWKANQLYLEVKKATTISHISLWNSFLNLEDLKLEDDFEKPFGGDDHAALAAPFSKLTLTHLVLVRCYGLTTLMTLSIARSLVHLTHLSVGYCPQIEEIIMKQKVENDEDKEICFSKLEFLELHHLPRLKRFCSYNYTFGFPLLECAIIKYCPQLTMFCLGTIHTPQLQSIQYNYQEIWDINLNKTILYGQRFVGPREMVMDEDDVCMMRNDQFPTDPYSTVEILRITSIVDKGVTFPYTLLTRFPLLNELFVEDSSFENIFLSHEHIVDPMGKILPFKKLYLDNLDQLKNIWKDDSQLPLVHQNLTYLQVKSCCNLVELAPSSTSFQNLRELFVSGCHKLIHLVSNSTAKSLVSLEELRIDHCKKMKEIVMNETNEDLEGGITFNQLWRIELIDMPSLKMFSSQTHTFEFLKLKDIQIIGCPEMKMFCQGVLETPKLFKVKIEEHDMEWKDKGDLNKTMEMLSPAKDNVII